MTHTQQDIQKKPNDDETGRSSLLVSFANLLGRYGAAVSPTDLDKFFIDNNIQDVNFNSITKFDSRLAVSAFGSNGQPFKDNAIMRFEYLSSETGKIITHYCLVNNSRENTIIDSFSGIIKSYNIYGGTASWAAFVFKQPEPLPSDVLAIETPQAEEALVIEEESITEPINESCDDDKEEVVLVPIKLTTKNNNLWQATYKPGLNTVDTVSVIDINITDLSGALPDKELKSNMIVPVVGRFEKDGQLYYRTAKSVEDGVWYGIPANALISKSRYKGNNDDDDINEIYDESTKDKIIKAAAKIEGKTKKLFNFGRTR